MQNVNKDRNMRLRYNNNVCNLGNMIFYLQYNSNNNNAIIIVMRKI